MTAEARGLSRARALAASAVASYKKYKKAAEATVAAWHWATGQTLSPEPGHFECNKIGRGKKLPGKPAALNYHVEQGVDARGRLVVLRNYVKDWNDCAELFYRYESDGIVGLRFVSPKHLGYAKWFATEGDKVTAIDSVFTEGIRSRVYRFDTKGHYTGLSDVGNYGDQPIDQPFDIECNDEGRIVRTWWVWPTTGKRDLYWEHSSVKGKPAAKKSAAKKSAAKKPAAKKLAAKKPAAKKPAAKKSAVKKARRA